MRKVSNKYKFEGGPLDMQNFEKPLVGQNEFIKKKRNQVAAKDRWSLNVG